MKDKEYIWKIIHNPTQLFYCSRKGRFSDDLTNLSAKGSHYSSEKAAVKVLKEDCRRACINKAQTERCTLDRQYGFPYNGAKTEEFEILKYSLELITK